MPTGLPEGLAEFLGNFLAENDEEETSSSNTQAGSCHPERNEGSLVSLLASIITSRDVSLRSTRQHGVGARCPAPRSLDVGIWRLVTKNMIQLNKNYSLPERLADFIPI